jgi:hypothetical protein
MHTLRSHVRKRPSSMTEARDNEVGTQAEDVRARKERERDELYSPDTFRAGGGVSA